MNSSLLRRARRPSLLWVRLVFLSTVSILPTGAQTLPAGSASQTGLTISVDVRLVTLHVSVRDKRGDFAGGLSSRNFKVFEDGRAQTIQEFQAEDVPVAVGLVIDNSGSMKTKQADAIAAAIAFAGASNPGDDLFIVNFHERPVLGLPDTRLFSASPAELESAIRSVLPAGKTALYDAIDRAIAHIQRSRADRKVLIVISDGGDNASTRTLGQVLSAIGRSDVQIFTIGLVDGDDSDNNPRVLRRIAAASGGEAFLLQDPAQAARVCRRIARDIRSQYTISYSPANQLFRGEYRAILVQAVGDRGAKLRARTRSGYLALPDAASGGGGR